MESGCEKNTAIITDSTFPCALGTVFCAAFCHIFHVGGSYDVRIFVNVKNYRKCTCK